MGRPSKYTEDLAAQICERLALGESLKRICTDDEMPDMGTVLRWLQKDEVFRGMYVRAREVQADSLFDEILDIADDGRNDWMQDRDEKGDEKTTAWRENGEALRRSHLRVEARKWMAAKLQPRKYSEKLQAEHSGPNGGPITMVTEVRRTVVDPKEA